MIYAFLFINLLVAVVPCSAKQPKVKKKSMADTQQNKNKRKSELLALFGFVTKKIYTELAAELEGIEQKIYNLDKDIAAMLRHEKTDAATQEIELLQKEIKNLQAQIYTYEKKLKRDPKQRTIAYGIQEKKEQATQKMEQYKQMLAVKKAIHVPKKRKSVEDADITVDPGYILLSAIQKKHLAELQEKRTKNRAHELLMIELMELVGQSEQAVHEAIDS